VPRELWSVLFIETQAPEVGPSILVEAVFAGDPAHVDPLIDELRLEFRRAFRDVITAAINRGIASGELPPQNAQVVAAALVGAMGEALIGPLATGTEEPDTISTLIQFTLRAIGSGHAHS